MSLMRNCNKINAVLYVELDSLSRAHTRTRARCTGEMGKEKESSRHFIGDFYSFTRARKFARTRTPALAHALCRVRASAAVVGF